MLFDDSYQTLTSDSEGYFMDRGSKFFAFAFPISSEDDFKKKLQEIKKKHPKATHHTYSYRLGADQTAYRMNDDGEPSGTAGRPIYGQILSHQLTNTGVIVVRYFGGTMLGVPGLINAYKNAALDALQKNKIIQKTWNDVYVIEFDYEQLNEVWKIIKDLHIAVLEQQTETTCRMKLEIRKSNLAICLQKLEEIEKIKISYVYSC